MSYRQNNNKQNKNTIVPWEGESAHILESKILTPVNKNLNKKINFEAQLKTEGDALLFTESNEAEKLNKQISDKQGIQPVQEEDPIKQEEEEQVQQEEGMEQGKITKFYFERLMNFEYTLLFFALTNIGFSIIYYDNDYKDNNITITNACLWVIFLTTLIQIVLNSLRYSSLLELEKWQLLVSKRDTLISTGKIYNIIVEVIIVLLQPYPFLNDIQISTFDYYDSLPLDFKLNWILTILSFIRIFIILRVILKKTPYLTPRASRLCKMYGCSADYNFAVKCLFKDYPISLIFALFVLSLSFFAFSLRICERPLNRILEENAMNFESYENTIWCTVITMTTIGYGEFFPRTLFGRILDIVIAIWGIFTVSLTVVVLNNTLSMDPSEKKSLTVLNRLSTRKELREKAANLLTCMAKYRIIEKQRKLEGLANPISYLQQKQMKIKRAGDEFNQINRKIKSQYDKDDLYEEMARQFDYIRDDIKVLNENQDKLNKYLQENFNLGMMKPQKISE